MKNTAKEMLFLIFILPVFLAPQGCGDSSEPKTTATVTPAEKGNPLTANIWKMTAFTSQAASGAVTDLFAKLPECAKDDTLQFKGDNSYVNDSGELECDLLNPRTSTGTWVLSASGTELTKDGRDALKIENISSTALIVTQTKAVGGENRQYTLTFTAR